MSVRLPLLLAAILVLGTGCRPEVKTSVLMPPVVFVPGVKRITVIPFRALRRGKRDGYILADLLRRHLAGSSAKRFFRVLGIKSTPEGFQRILQKKAVSDSATARVLRRKGQDAFLVGRVLEHDLFDRPIRKEQIGRAPLPGQRSTVRIRRRLRGSGRPSRGLFERRLENTYCHQRKLRMIAEVRMVDIRQKAALEMFRVQRSVYVQVERCGDRIQSLPSGEAMTQQALRRLAEQLAKPMIPTAISVSLPLADDPKIPSLRQGIYWAQKQKWYRARKIWKKIAKQDPRCSHAWYNLGVLSEIKGQLALAQQLYTKAEQLDSKDLYVRAVERILARIDLLKASRKRHRIPKK